MSSSDEGLFGIYFPHNDTVMTDSNMNSVADAMRAVHGYGLEQATQFGLLVYKGTEGSWHFTGANPIPLPEMGELKDGGLGIGQGAGVGTEKM